jgi:hypothetical protein
MLQSRPSYSLVLWLPGAIRTHSVADEVRGHGTRRFNTVSTKAYDWISFLIFRMKFISKGNSLGWFIMLVLCHHWSRNQVSYDDWRSYITFKAQLPLRGGHIIFFGLKGMEKQLASDLPHDHILRKIAAISVTWWVPLSQTIKLHI